MIAALAPTLVPEDTPFTLPHFMLWSRHLVLDNGEPWEVELFQYDFVGDVFAGTRECWLIVPEGNAKTTLVAGIALYHAQHTRSAMVPVAASSRDQAQILFQQAEGFIDRSEYLQQHGFRAQAGYRLVRHYPTGSKVQIFSADDRTGDGVIPSLCIVDELHRHHNMRLYRTWQGKLDKRDGQLIAISTSGEPESEFEQARQRIREETTEVKRTETYLRSVSQTIAYHEWAVPVSANIEDLRIVKAANPLTSITIEKLQQKRDSPTMTDTHFRRFCCNQAMRGELSAVAGAEWSAAWSHEVIPLGAPIYLGLDIAWKLDCTALVPLYVRPMTVEESLLSRLSALHVVADEDENEEKPVRRNIHLLGDADILTPPRNGISLDPDKVEQALRDMHDRNPIRTVVMDPTRAEQLAIWITRELGATVVERQQSNPLKAIDHDRFMEGLREGWLKHTGDAGLTKHVLHAVDHLLPNGKTVFERPTVGRAYTNELQDRRVIDALTAAAMVNAYAYAEDSQPADPEPLVYLGT